MLFGYSVVVGLFASIAFAARWSSADVQMIPRIIDDMHVVIFLVTKEELAQSPPCRSSIRSILTQIHSALAPLASATLNRHPPFLT